MKLGTETGSLTNAMMSRCLQPVPEVGMGCTMIRWSDRHAGTIVKVTAKQIHVQRDKATRVDKNGMSESQQYSYESDPNESITIFRLTKRGWRETGGGASLLIGERAEHYDYSF